MNAGNGVCQDGDSSCSQEAQKINEIIQPTSSEEIVESDKANIPIGASADGRARTAERECKDRYSQCTQYFNQGECQKNPGIIHPKLTPNLHPKSGASFLFIYFTPKPGSTFTPTGWMIMFCPASCNACELRDPKIRCDRQRLNISTEVDYTCTNTPVTIFNTDQNTLLPYKSLR